MNYKLLFPTYRTRQRWVLQAVDEIRAGGRVSEILNVGCGEGSLDRQLMLRCERMVSLDANADDVRFARQLNADLSELHYDVQDALCLPYESGRFAVATCLDVIEHVSDPRELLRELTRVVQPGGHVLLTCPSLHFPVTYDPINWALAPLRKHLSIGAYGYGHSWLVGEEELSAWLRALDLEIVRCARLSHALAAALECYWPGLAQRLLKANSGNQARAAGGRFTMRPSNEEPRLAQWTDRLIAWDERIFASSERSVGLAYFLRKSASPTVAHQAEPEAP